jgi:hypothetical protein
MAPIAASIGGRPVSCLKSHGNGTEGKGAQRPVSAQMGGMWDIPTVYTGGEAYPACIPQNPRVARAPSCRSSHFQPMQVSLSRLWIPIPRQLRWRHPVSNGFLSY